MSCNTDRRMGHYFRAQKFSSVGQACFRFSEHRSVICATVLLLLLLTEKEEGIFPCLLCLFPLFKALSCKT